MKELGRNSVQSYLFERVEALGGVCEHFTTPGKRGPPDCIISWPGGIADFVETKAEKGVLKSWQERDHKRRRKLGFLVVVAWSEAHVDDYIRRCCPPTTIKNVRIVFD